MSAAFDQITQADDGVALSSTGEARDFFALLKPRVMSLVVITAMAGMATAPGSVHPVIALASLLEQYLRHGQNLCRPIMKMEDYIGALTKQKIKLMAWRW